MADALSHNLQWVRQRLAEACARTGRDPSEVQILAVTKTHPVEVLWAASGVGLRDVGENRVQEGLRKLAELDSAPAAAAPLAAPRPRVHLIGRLQTNKVNKAVGAFASIASVDHWELLQKVASRAAELGHEQAVWIQVNVSREPQKGGCPPQEATRLWDLALAERWLLPMGLMTIGRLGALEAEARAGFALLRRSAEALRRRDGGPAGLSMGMSDDFESAVLEGSTQVRLGSVLFGPRRQVVPDS